MTEGTSQGLFIVVAIVIFGIFIGLTYTIFGDVLEPALVEIFGDGVKKGGYNVDGAVPSEESDFIFDDVDTIIGYKGTDTEIVIPEEIRGKKVTTISGDAFNNRNLTSVIMPNTITTIEDGRIEGGSIVFGAFANNSIGTISFSNNLSKIGKFAFFRGTLDMETIVLPTKLKIISEAAFKENELKEITLPAEVEEIDKEAFKDNELERVEFEGTLPAIAEDAFEGNKETLLIIPEGTTEIPDGEYKEKELTGVIIPEGVEVIGEEAFEGNDLESITLPSTITNIKKDAFKDNNISTPILFPEGLLYIGDYAFYGNQIPVAYLPESLLDIGYYAFYGNKLSDINITSKLTIVKDWSFAYNVIPEMPKIPTNIKTVDKNAFYGNPFALDGDGEEDGDIPNENIIYEDYYNSLTPTFYGDFSFDKTTGTLTSYAGTEKDIVIPNTIDGVTVEHIGDTDFSASWSTGDSHYITFKLTSVVLPPNLKTIGESSFKSNNITNVVMPDSVTNVGKMAFYNNTTIENVVLSDSLIKLGESAFENNKVKVLKIPDSLKVIEKTTFKNNAIVTLDLGNVVSISEGAFNTNNLGNLELPDSLKVVGKDAFRVNAIDSVEFPTGMTAIGEFSFYDNPSIKVEVTKEINDLLVKQTQHTTNTVGQMVFFRDAIPSQPYAIDTATGTIKDYWGQDSDIVIPSSIYGVTVEHIGKDAFSSPANSATTTNNTYKDITSVEFPDTLKTIGESAFNSNLIEELSIPDSVTTIGMSAFNTNKISKLKLSSSVTAYPQMVFYSNNLSHVEIPDTVKSIGYGVFGRNYNTHKINLDTVSLSRKTTTIDKNAFTGSTTSLVYRD